MDAKAEVTCTHGCKLKLMVHDRGIRRVVLGLSYRESRPQKITLVRTSPADRSRPGCSKHLRVPLVDKRDAVDDNDGEEEAQEQTEGEFAYMACLWAPSD